MTDTPGPEEWRDYLDDLEAPSVGKLAHALADAREGLSLDTAQDVVDTALDDGELVEDPDAGAFGVVSLPDDRDDTPDDDGGLPGYTKLLRAAQDRAGREAWEPVEETALRAVLDEHGVAHLLDDGVLGGTSRWRVVDVSDDEEEPRRRWYYATGEEPRPDEFRRFHRLLTDDAPDGYEPHYFRVGRAGKDPATQFGSWKRDDARLSVEDAVAWMEKGGNVGIAGRGECKVCDGSGTVDDEGDGEAECGRCDGTGDLDGPLVNVDIDDDEETTPDDVPDSLRARSRSRTGWHTWYFDTDDEIPNIPTDEYGEVRADWQYVVAPGSFVASTAEDIPDDAADPGYYTVEDPNPVARIEYDDLPAVFLDAAETDDGGEEQHAHADLPAGVGVGDTADTRHTHGAGDTLDLDGEDLPNDGTSAVYDVDADAVLSGTHDESDRFSSVFHNSATGANMSVSGGKLHCWRHNVAHGGLQALAVLSDKTPHGCKALGAPHKNSGVGPNRLKGDWRLIWPAWHYGKRQGYIPDDDPLPYRVLLGLAVEGGVVDGPEAFVERRRDTGAVVENPEAYDGETYTAFPPGTYNEALEYADDQADVPLGRDPVDTGEDTDPIAALPFGGLDALAPDERRRAVRRRGVEWPDTADARKQLRDTLVRELRAETQTVVDAPTALGKSHAVATEPWRDLDDDVTGGSPVVHLHPTRDARDDAHEASCAELGDENTRRLLGGPEACPCAGGDHDPRNADDDEDTQAVTVDGEPVSEFLQRMRDERGISFSVAHGWAREYNDQGLENLPCAPGDLICESQAQWATVPWNNEGEPSYDVIHATHPFAHVPGLRHGVNLVFDEEPDFTADISHERARRAVTAFLSLSDDGPNTWEELVTTARQYNGSPYDDDSVRADVPGGQRIKNQYLGAVEALTHDPAREWYFQDPDAHTLARPIADAVFRALVDTDPFGCNGRASAQVAHHPPRFDDDAHEWDGWNREYVTVVVDEQNTITRVRAAPDLSGARAVIGLDAHPSMPVWELNTHPDMTREAVLAPTERELWRRYERGLTTVQVGEATRPRSGPKAGEWLNESRVQAVLDALAEEFGQEFETAITTAQVEPAVRRLLAETLGTATEALDDDQTLHFGEEKSRNPAAFANADAGYVYGCMDPGDEFVLDTLAELGLEATPGTAETDDGVTVREKGRTFDGPDADTARAVLASVRENHVAQAAGRYARNPDEEDSGATVFVHTDAAPEGFVDVEAPGVEWLATDLQREILDELTDRPTATTREIADAVDCSKKHAWSTLSELAEEGVVTRTEGTGDYGADEYQAEAVTDGLVSLGIDQTITDPLLDPNRWSVMILGQDQTSAEGPKQAATDGGLAEVCSLRPDPDPDRWGLSGRVVASSGTDPPGETQTVPDPPA